MTSLASVILPISEASRPLPTRVFRIVLYAMPLLPLSVFLFHDPLLVFPIAIGFETTLFSFGFLNELRVPPFADVCNLLLFPLFEHALVLVAA